MEWLRRASDDLAFAKAGYQDTGIGYITCFLAQQTVEKTLKGFLTYNGIKLERIHLLPKLLAECVKFDEELSKFAPACKELSAYYIPTRYPVFIPFQCSKEKVKSALEDAEEILEFIKKKIISAGSSEE